MLSTDRALRARRLPARDLRLRPGVRRFERWLAVIVPVFALVYTAQGLDTFAADRSWLLAGPWGAAVVVLVAAALLAGLAAGAAALLGGRPEVLAVVAAGALCAADLAVLPVLGQARPGPTLPWLVILAPLTSAYLAVALRSPLVPVAAAIGTATALAAGFGLLASYPVALVVPNAVLDVALGSALAVVIAAARHSVTRAADAERAALDAYAQARLDDATEAEQVRTDALVHDSVLTTLLQAASADGPEGEDLTRRMADNALRVLAHLRRSAALGPVAPLRRSIETASEALDGLLPHFEVDSGDLEDLVLPVEAAEAVVGALVEVLRSSVERAGPGRRTLRLLPLGPDGLRVVVEDASPDRLGAPRPLAPAAVERLHRVNGRLDVTEEPWGRTVVVSWGSIVVSGVHPGARVGSEGAA